MDAIIDFGQDGQEKFTFPHKGTDSPVLLRVWDENKDLTYLKSRVYPKWKHKELWKDSCNVNKPWSLQKINKTNMGLRNQSMLYAKRGQRNGRKEQPGSSIPTRHD